VSEEKNLAGKSFVKESCTFEHINFAGVSRWGKSVKAGGRMAKNSDSTANMH